jgi:hypothetical protein
MGHLALSSIEIIFLKKEIGGVFTRFKSRNVWQPCQLLMSKDMNENVTSLESRLLKYVPLFYFFK